MKRTVLIAVLVLVALLASAFLAMFLIARIALAPAADEWSAPMKIGPLRFEVGVPTTIRLATISWFGPYLAGRTLDTRFGPMRLGWDDAHNALELQCEPCTAALPAFGERQPLRVAKLRLTARRDVDYLIGTIEATPQGYAQLPVRGRWSGVLSQRTLDLRIESTPAPIAQWYALLVPQLPESRQARIDGSLALQAQLKLPARQLDVQARANGFRVDGLDVQTLLDGRLPCGTPSQLKMDHWLARSVIAAEDPRYLQQASYDLADTATVLAGVTPQQLHAPSMSERLAARLLDHTPSGSLAEHMLRQLLYTVRLEQVLGKSGVVLDRLDHASWGPQACGAEAASRYYFRTSARTLSPAQSVWLATMLADPVAALAQWRRDGRLDPERTRTVAEAVRGITRGERDVLMRSTANARFTPPPEPKPPTAAPPAAAAAPKAGAKSKAKSTKSTKPAKSSGAARRKSAANHHATVPSRA